MNQRNELKIGVLIGAGVSNIKPLPDTKKITEEILKGHNYARYTDGTYYISNDNKSDEYTLRINKYLALLYREISSYYSDRPVKKPNYEDIFFLTKQIEDSLSTEFDNPAILALFDKLEPDIESVLSLNTQSPLTRRWDINKLIEESANYIIDIIVLMLNKEPENYKAFKLFSEIQSDIEVDKFNIFTLNHDILLENYFSSNNIEFSDGFYKWVSDDLYKDISFWNFDMFQIDKSKIKLLKLHGSISWYRYFKPSSSFSGDEIYGKNKTLTESNNTLLNYQETMPKLRRPEILVGTYNKMLDYIGGIYSDMFYYFQQLLRETNLLVVSGYSFGDKGVNTFLIDWISNYDENRIVIIHPDPDGLKKDCRGNIRNKWDDLESSKRLIVIPRRIEDSSWSEIKQKIKSD